MELGMVGLGRMGGNMVRRLIKDGHTCIGFARNPQTLTIAVDNRGRSMRNLRGNPKVAVEVLGDDLCYGLRGTAVVEKETMASAPFPCALVAVKLEEVRDHFHPGKEHRRGVEEAVFAELKGPAPAI